MNKIGVGAAGVVVLTTGAISGVGTAGIMVAVVGAIAGAAYVGRKGYQLHKRHVWAHAAKTDHRDANGWIARSSRRELYELMRSGEPVSITTGRGDYVGGKLLFAAEKEHQLDPHDNVRLAIDVIAMELLDAISGDGPLSPLQSFFVDLLLEMGLDETIMYASEILIRDKLEQGDEATALEMARKLVAPALGATLVASDAHPTLFFEALRAACRREDIPLEVVEALDVQRSEYYQRIAARLFTTVDPKVFMRSMVNLLRAEDCAVLPPERSAFVSGIRNLVGFLANPAGAASLAWGSSVRSHFVNRLRDACTSAQVKLAYIDSLVEPERSTSLEHIAETLFGEFGHQRSIDSLAALLQTAKDAGLNTKDAGLKTRDWKVVRSLGAILGYLQSPAGALLLEQWHARQLDYACRTAGVELERIEILGEPGHGQGCAMVARALAGTIGFKRSIDLILNLQSGTQPIKTQSLPDIHTCLIDLEVASRGSIPLDSTGPAQKT